MSFCTLLRDLCNYCFTLVRLKTGTHKNRDRVVIQDLYAEFTVFCVWPCRRSSRSRNVPRKTSTRPLQPWMQMIRARGQPRCMTFPEMQTASSCWVGATSLTVMVKRAIGPTWKTSTTALPVSAACISQLAVHAFTLQQTARNQHLRHVHLRRLQQAALPPAAQSPRLQRNDCCCS